MKNHNVIYHNECSCLFADSVFDDRCIKRYYLVNDVESDEFNKQKVIAICNDYLRVKAREYMYSKYDGSNDYRFYSNRKHIIIRMLVEEIILEHICKKSQADDSMLHYRDTNQNDLLNTRVNIMICDKPLIYRCYKFSAAIEFALDGNWYFQEECLSNIRLYMEQNNYKKYKTKYAFCNKLIRDIRRSYGEEKKIKIIELFNQLFKLKIKNK